MTAEYSIIEPTLGRIVIYTSRNGDGIQSPAVVVRTKKTTNLEVIERWRPGGVGTLSGGGRPDDLVVELPDDHTIDICVLGLGGIYYEYAVPFDYDDGARTWKWPERV